MKIRTTRFGEMDIEEEKIICMPRGIPGFADSKRFVIFEHKRDSPFFWYQSLDDPDLAFVITDPLLFEPDYKPGTETVVKEMNWPNDSNLDIFVIVTIPHGRPQDMTANLIGPILVNLDTRKAVQMLMVNTHYNHKQPLLGQSAEKRERKAGSF